MNKILILAAAALAVGLAGCSKPEEGDMNATNSDSTMSNNASNGDSMSSNTSDNMAGNSMESTNSMEGGNSMGDTNSMEGGNSMGGSTMGSSNSASPMSGTK